MKRILRETGRNEEGNVALIFAVSLLVLFGAAGGAIDYVRYSQVKTAYSAAADSAALAAVSAAVKAEQAGKSGIPEIGRAAAESVWKANMANLGATAAAEPEINVNHGGKSWTATVSYDETVPTTFMGLLGVDNIQMAGSAQSSTSVEKVKQYWEFSIVVDDSSSMGIGATQADMDKLIANPKIGCSFACHWADYKTGGTDSASVAKAAGIKLRIDVVDDAVDGMIDAMEDAESESNIRAKLYGLNRNVDVLVSMSSDLEKIADHDIKLSTTTASIGNTDYAAALATLQGKVGVAGDGSSASKPRKAVFIVTDGIHDSNVWESNVVLVPWSDHQLGPIDPAFCSQMKSNGVSVGVLYIDYITPAGYEGYVNPYKANVLPSLKGCASDGLFFNATTPAGIKAAMLDMLAAAFSAGDVRLTQ